MLSISARIPIAMKLITTSYIYSDSVIIVIFTYSVRRPVVILNTPVRYGYIGLEFLNSSWCCLAYLIMLKADLTSGIMDRCNKKEQMTLVQFS